MKKKSLATLLSGFLTVSLTGVGFASWVITGGDSEDVNGTVNVETVSDQRVQIRECTSTELETITDEDFVIQFGHKADNSIQNPWFQSVGSDVVEEDLTAKIPFYIKNHTHATVTVTFDAALTALTGSSTPEDTSDDYVVLNYSYTEPTGDTSTTEGLAYINLNFAWGQAFGGKNPYSYYNGQDYSDALATKALALFGTGGTIKSITSFTMVINGAYKA